MKGTHGKRGQLAARVCAVLNSLPAFYEYGGIKQEAMLAKLRQLLAEKSVAEEQDKHVSGKRTENDSEDLHNCLISMIGEVDDATSSSKEVDKAAAEEQARKDARAAKVKKET